MKLLDPVAVRIVSNDEISREANDYLYSFLYFYTFIHMQYYNRHNS